tara:strand:+ start:71 stop:424 length:354 start_codon:yes stop_codon:yes gene_type:complete
MEIKTMVVTKTTEENFGERFGTVELRLAEQGFTAEDLGFHEGIKSHSWFFWFMTIFTCGGWWVVFGNMRTESNNEHAYSWTDKQIKIIHELDLSAALVKVAQSNLEDIEEQALREAE